jgi:hypothetical protein
MYSNADWDLLLISEFFCLLYIGKRKGMIYVWLWMDLNFASVFLFAGTQAC